MGTAVFFGLNPILIKKGLDAGGDQTKGTFYMLASHLLSMVMLLVLFWDEGYSLCLGGGEVVWLALAGISNYALAISCYFRSIGALGASRTASIVNANPSLSVIMAVIFLGEKSHPAIWIGIILVLGGAYLIGKA